jgi:hypothetical protein
LSSFLSGLFFPVIEIFIRFERYVPVNIGFTPFPVNTDITRPRASWRGNTPADINITIITPASIPPAAVPADPANTYPAGPAIPYPADRTAITDAYSPAAGIRIVPYGNAPGDRSWVVMISIPRTIVPSGAVDYRATVHITANIAGIVANVNDFRRVIINVHILHVIYW